MALTTTTVIMLGVAAAATAASIDQSKKATRQSRRAQQAQQRQADIANARQRRDTARRARVAMASTENQGAVMGAGGSSSIAGAQAGIQQQLGENLSFLDRNAQLSQRASDANIRAARYSSNAATWASVANLSMQGVGQFGGHRPPSNQENINMAGGK